MEVTIVTQGKTVGVFQGIWGVEGHLAAGLGLESADEGVDAVQRRHVVDAHHEATEGLDVLLDALVLAKLAEMLSQFALLVNVAESSTHEIAEARQVGGRVGEAAQPCQSMTLQACDG